MYTCQMHMKCAYLYNTLLTCLQLVIQIFLARILQRVLDMREYMRRRETGDGPIAHNVDLNRRANVRYVQIVSLVQI